MNLKRYKIYKEISPFIPFSDNVNINIIGWVNVSVEGL